MTWASRWNARAAVLNLYDVSVPVPPPGVHQRGSLDRPEIHDCLRQGGRKRRRDLGERGRGQRAREQEGRALETESPHHIAPAVAGRSACRTFTT